MGWQEIVLDVTISQGERSFRVLRLVTVLQRPRVYVAHSLLCPLMMHCCGEFADGFCRAKALAT